MRKYISTGLVSCALTGLVLSFVGARLMPDADVSNMSMVEREDEITRLIEDGICWGNDGFRHPTPSHVIYDGSLRGSRLTHLVLDQMFDGVDHKLDLSKVGAFCL